MHEIRKVKLLSTKEEKFTVTKDETKQEEDEFDEFPMNNEEQIDFEEPMMYKKIADFVMPEDA